MKLVTKAIKEKLEKNFRRTMETGESGDVVLKLCGVCLRRPERSR